MYANVRAECEAETVVDQSYRAIPSSQSIAEDSVARIHVSIKIRLRRYIRNASGFKRRSAYCYFLQFEFNTLIVNQTSRQSESIPREFSLAWSIRRTVIFIKFGAKIG